MRQQTPRRPAIESPPDPGHGSCLDTPLRVADEGGGPITTLGRVRQAQHRDQAGARHQVRIIEDGSDRAKTFTYEVSLARVSNRVCGNSDSPAQARAISFYTTLTQSKSPVDQG